MVHLPDYKIDPPEIETKIISRCAECKSDLLEGESVYKVGNKVFCEDCVEHVTLEREEPDWDSMPGGYDY